MLWRLHFNFSKFNAKRQITGPIVSTNKIAQFVNVFEEKKKYSVNCLHNLLVANDFSFIHIS